MTYIPPKLFLSTKEQAGQDNRRPVTIAFRQIERWANGLAIPTGGGGGLYASLTGPGETVTPGDLTQAGGLTVNCGVTGFNVNSTPGHTTFSVNQGNNSALLFNSSTGGQVTSLSMNPYNQITMQATQIPPPSGGFISAGTSILIRATGYPTYSPASIDIVAANGAYTHASLITLPSAGGSYYNGSGGQQGILLHDEVGGIRLDSTGRVSGYGLGCNFQCTGSDFTMRLESGPRSTDTTDLPHTFHMWTLDLRGATPPFLPYGFIESSLFLVEWVFDVTGGVIWANTGGPTGSNVWRRIAG